MEALSRINGADAAGSTVLSTRMDQRTPNFGALVGAGIGHLNQNIGVAEQALSAYALGGEISTHELMLTMEKARFSMQVAVEIRNRLVESYGELTRMQV